MLRRQTIAGLVIATLVLAVAGCDLTRESDHAALRTFGSIYTAVGAADIQTNGESAIVDIGTPGAGGVAVEMSPGERLNVYFEPIEMPVGSRFETAVLGLIDGRRRVLGRITHQQTGPTTTAIGLDFHELRKYTESDRVSVSTYLEGVKTYDTEISLDSTSTVGFVDSGESGWATSYHWIYIDGSWILMVDPAPSETFTLVSRPSVSLPFNYLVFAINGVEGIGLPETMEFVGEGVSRLTIRGQDDRKLLF